MKRPTGRFWLDTFFSRKSTERFPDRDLRGRRIVFTGGTDGLGRVAVERFAAMGADICLLGRNRAKTEGLRETLARAGHPGRFSAVHCDLSAMESVRAAAESVLADARGVDLLINCAGVNAYDRTLSADGFELNFAVNYLGPFLLTELLLDALLRGDAARVINVSSGTQEAAKLDFADLQREKKWSLFASYAQAKLCLIMHTRDLARRLKDSPVTVNSLNPGYIDTALMRDVKGPEKLWMPMHRYLAAPTWVGGERLVAAALDENYKHASGAFIYEDMLLAPNPQALDEDAVARLMTISRGMCGLPEPEAAGAVSA